MESSGSPPRGRGKAYRAAGHCTRRGITPAWAGKRDKPALILRVVKNHPRVGGEKSAIRLCVAWTAESPPRGRGKDFFCGLGFCSERITPAWAGKRCSRRLCPSGRRNHPRVGGEKIASCTVCRVSMESPPRGRGKVDCLLLQPASRPDHPRVGGEKLCSSLMRALWSGSPPHGRGKGIVNGRAGLLVGITPALAGKSLCRKFGGTIF